MTTRETLMYSLEAKALRDENYLFPQNIHGIKTRLPNWISSKRDGDKAVIA
jgi:hypothetical protein